ncbi:sensor histidine kinase [Enhygromyxa salina]|uniref:histidine kinase n=1 Tax=Enhygromyxa salina TaxID=215803 RepID=A0A2S9YMF4_9BACT|nr:HAMP domain-containing sensor histidine kinase [Enhygromyxa salina]PRQ06263.1 Sensor histidine kinase YycG [Enhygromyxa salina]
MQARAREGGLLRGRIYLGVAGLIMLVGLVLLLRGALAASVAEQQLRREALAARVFDELEGSLASFVAAEQARPFVQWRREWVAAASKREPIASRSPLAEIPDRPFVLGYFQIEPDGQFASPMLPGPDEPRDDPTQAPALARAEQLRALNQDLENSEPVAVLDQPQQQQQIQQQAQQQAVPEDVQIQRALDQQSIARQRKNAAANSNNIGFDPDLEQLANFLADDAAQLDDALDVRVTSFVAEPIGDSLRLIRTVEIGGQRWLQGLVVDRHALERWLEQDVLGSPELSGFVKLEWGAGGSVNAEAGRWTHQFAPPFSELQVTAALGPVNTLASHSARVVLGLGLGLGLALLVVLIAVERTLAGLHARAQERERIVAAVTHELRTPLTSIRMYSEMLEQGIVADPERQRGYHKTIRTEAERLSRLVDQVLLLARLDGRGGPKVIEQAALARLDEVVAGVGELLRPQADARGLVVDVELGEGTAGAMVARDSLTQILTNLADNALKFTPCEGEAVQLCAWRDGDRLRVAVRDRGAGVEPQVLPHMFEAFVRGPREAEQAVPGTGMGLAVVQSLVDELGGEVWGQNRAGGGLEVELSLPGFHDGRRASS